MNKYKEALEDLLDYLQEYHEHYHDDVSFENRKLLKELVDKATPKKVKVIDYNFGIFECPHCRANIYWSGNKKDHKHCLRCGQALDWSEEDENS